MLSIIGHRGYSGYYPENSILAIQKALASGADGVEIDVNMTKDRKLIVFHDSSLKNLTGFDGKVSATMYAAIQELRSHGEPIPLLEEALDCLKLGGARIIILDIKAAGCEHELLSVLKGHDCIEQVILSSANSTLLKKIRKVQPTAKIAFITDNRPDKTRTLKKLHLELGLYSVHPYHKRPVLTGRFMKNMQKSGLKVYPWFLRGVKNMKRITELAHQGVDGIITDYPDEAIRTLKK